MRILYYTWNEVMKSDVAGTLRSAGHEVAEISYPVKNYIKDADFTAYIENVLSGGGFDCIFTMNYLPVLAKISFRRRLAYIAWISDSPNYTTYSEMIHSPYSYIFHFDRSEAENLKRTGARNIYHLPLAVNTRRVKQLTESSAVQKEYKADVSFLGNLYQDEYNFFEQINGLTAYQRGFIDAVLRAQLQFQGCDLLEEAIPKPFMSELLGLVKFNLDSELMLSDEKVMLGMLRKNASVIERKEILELLSKHFQTVLYSQSDSSMLPLVENRGYLDYSTQMPVMFNQSSININITLRCILSGISLRALDIMGAGGFLLSNYQPELAEFFEEGKEMVMFYDRKDLLEKTRYYLLHDDERREIASNGRKKVEELFDYSYAWERIFGEVFK